MRELKLDAGLARSDKAWHVLLVAATIILPIVIIGGMIGLVLIR